MLTFKKGNYSKEDLSRLFDALTAACDSLRCAESGCDNCINRKPCADLSRCRVYVYITWNSMGKSNK